MPRYYVAGIPFDSNDALQHYGVKGMKWNQHIFGIDANDKYINWLKDAGQNIGKFTNNAAKTIGNAAAGASREVGKALNKASNFVTGNQARQNVDTANTRLSNAQAGRTAVNAASKNAQNLSNQAAQYRKAAEQNRQDIANRDPNKQYAKSAEGLDYLDYLDRIGTDRNDRLARETQAKADTAHQQANQLAREQRNEERAAYNNAQNAQRAYDRTLPGAAENAARGAQGFLNSAGKWVSTAANDAKNWAGNAVTGVGKAANQAGQWIGDRAKDVGDLAGQAVNDAGKAASDVGNAVGNAANGAREWLGNMFNGAKEWAGNAVKDVGNVATDAWNGVSDAANQAGQWIGDRAKESGEAIGNAAKDVRDFVSEMENPHVQIDAEKVKENYRNYLNEHPENPQSPGHEEWLKEQIKNDPQLREYYESQVKEQKAPENYDDRIRTSGSSLSSAKTASERETVLRDLVSAIDSEKGFGGGSDFQNDTPMSYWAERAKNNFDEIDNLERALKYEDDPNSEHYRRLKKDLDYHRIDNDILTGEFYQNPNAAGKFGPGNINYNNKPDNVSQENWDYYCGENYGVGPMANLYGMSMREREDYDRQHFRHSALSDKPEGVGDAFWQNYITHGGTREDYERDWR